MIAKIQINTLLVAALLSSSVLFGAEISVSPSGNISTLPRGMEAVYVPIATRQELESSESVPRDQGKAR